MSVDYNGDDATFIINCLKSLRSIMKMKYLEIYNNSDLDIYNNSNNIKVKLNRIIDIYDTENNKAELIKEGLIKEEKSDDVYDEEEDVQLGYSIVKSNKEVSGVFMVDGKIKDVDYFKEGEEIE